mmetsp:Transcript_9672/g.14898  ORF Transcript_9672/g.14898 Transcript_9672/m.14898 type:complete len:207 (-) Transcript_9672:276-896(-)
MASSIPLDAGWSWSEGADPSTFAGSTALTASAASAVWAESAGSGGAATAAGADISLEVGVADKCLMRMLPLESDCTSRPKFRKTEGLERPSVTTTRSSGFCRRSLSITASFRDTKTEGMVTKEAFVLSTSGAMCTMPSSWLLAMMTATAPAAWPCSIFRWNGQTPRSNITTNLLEKCVCGASVTGVQPSRPALGYHSCVLRTSLRA